MTWFEIVSGLAYIVIAPCTLLLAVGNVIYDYQHRHRVRLIVDVICALLMIAAVLRLMIGR